MLPMFLTVQAGQPLTMDAIKEHLARKELVYQAMLLDKDKQMHQREVEIQKVEREMMLVKSDLKTLCENNDGMV